MIRWFPGYLSRRASFIGILRPCYRNFSEIVGGNSKIELNTVVNIGISKFLEDLKTDRRSKPTVPGTNSAIVGGVEHVYPFWHTRVFKYGPKKMEILARLIRKKPICEARKQLRFSKKKYGLDLSKALGIIENDIVERMKLDPKDFYIRDAIVHQGPSTYRQDILPPRRFVKITCRSSSVAIRIARYDRPVSDLEEAALQIRKIIKEKPCKLPWRKPIFSAIKRQYRYMDAPLASDNHAEPFLYYRRNMCDEKLYFNLKPTDQKIYRLPVSFQATPQTLVDTVSSSKRYLRMRASNTMQILRRKSITKYR